MIRSAGLLTVGCIFLLVFSCVLPAFAQTEQITLTTYYPAPFGIYQELAARRLKVGVNYMGTGTAVADNQLIVEGAIGIGTTAPARSLQVVSPAGQSAILIQSPVGVGGTTGIAFQDTSGGIQVNLRYLRTGFQELNINGNMVLDQGDYLNRHPSNNRICIRYRYSSTSGEMFCPAGYTPGGNNPVGAGQPRSGYLYCCR